MSSNSLLPEWAQVQLSDLMVDREVIEPANSPDTRFELWSVPAFPTGKPEMVHGVEIGSSKQRVEPGDVLLCKINPRINRVWKVGPRRDLPQIASTEWVVFRSNHIDSDFLVNRLREQGFRDKFCADLSGIGGSLTRARPQIFKSIQIALPGRHEQERIASALRELQARSRTVRGWLDSVPSLVDHFRRSVLAAAFRGDLTADWRAQNPDVEPASVLLDGAWAGALKKRGRGKRSRTEVANLNAQSNVPTELPNSWTFTPLGDICRLQAGYAFKSEWFKTAGIRLLRGVNIEPGGTRWNEVVHLDPDRVSEFSDYQLHEGDMVIAMDRPIISTGLKIAEIEMSDLPALLLQRVGRFIPRKGLDRRFLRYFLQSAYFQHHLSRQATGTQLPHVSANDIESCILPLPPVPEQQEIARLLSYWMAKIDAVDAGTGCLFDQLKQLDQSILAKAFRGELVPQDPDDEPASVLLERIREERAAASGGKPRRGRRKAGA